MGAALWVAAGVVTFLIARIVPLRRPVRWWPDLLLALLTALLAGVVATALDFGGWNEPDWRAAVFALLVSLAITGLARALR